MQPPSPPEKAFVILSKDFSYCSSSFHRKRHKECQKIQREDAFSCALVEWGLAPTEKVEVRKEKMRCLWQRVAPSLMLASRQRLSADLRTSFVAKLRKEVQSLSHAKQKGQAQDLSFLFGVGEKIRTSAPETRPKSLAGTPLIAT